MIRTACKVFTEFVTALLLFHVLLFLDHRHVGSQLPDHGSNPHPLCEALTSGILGKSLDHGLLDSRTENTYFFYLNKPVFGISVIAAQANEYIFHLYSFTPRGRLHSGSIVKNPPVIQETQV